MFESQLLIGGQARAAENQAITLRSNPGTGEVASQSAAASLNDADAAVAAAQAAFPAWSAMLPGERRKLLLKAAEVMDARTADFIARGVAEAGGVPDWYGFNVMLKASEACPALHSLIGEVFQQAGFPAGVVNVITNAPDDAPALVERLIANPAVRRVNFTGSTRVGRFAELLVRLNRQAIGSATRIAWLRLQEEVPVIDHGEITDKGSINQRAVLSRRAAQIDALYRGDDPHIIREVSASERL